MPHNHNEIKVTIKTGDIKGAGTDSNVYIALTDSRGHKSVDILLDVKWRDDFERGSKDAFNIGCISNIGDIKSIELWRDNRAISDDWFVEYVQVESRGNVSTFNCNCWIDAYKKYNYTINDSSVDGLGEFTDVSQEIISPQPQNEIKIFVKTGDVKGAGTDSNVYIAFITEKGTKSTDIHLDVKWRNSFEKGCTNVFTIKKFANIENIKSIEIWRDDKGVLDEWFVEHVIIEINDKQAPFPCHRWIEAHKKYHFCLYDSMLPQFDPFIEERKEELKKNKEKYAYSQVTVGRPRQVRKIPVEENFSFCDKFAMTFIKANLLVQSKLRSFLTGDNLSNFGAFLEFCKGDFKVPHGFYNWDSDVKFGEQRLRGCNPTLIRLCTKIPDNFQVTSEMVAPFLDGSTLEEVMKRKELFWVNLSIMEKLPCKEGKVVCAPMALFHAKKSGNLLPIAIQLFQQPSLNNPVFLPDDPPYTWLLAKMFFNNSDCSYHQTCTHLGFTHLLCESICVATHQMISPSHPVFQLLAPHFLYLIAINTLGLERLISPGGWVDITMSIGLDGMFELMKRVYSTWRFDQNGWLPNDIKERGVGDPTILKNYFFRDDALDIHAAILNYVTDVLSNVYDTPEKLKDDYEIQNWATCLTDEVNGAGIKGIFGGGKFEELSDLIKTVAGIIYICSVGHAAANFSQYDEYAFPPNYPALLLGSPPTTKTPLTIQDVISQLPTKETMLNTMVVTSLLSNRATNQLGDFEVQYQYTPECLAAVKRFQNALADISKKIDERNKDLKNPYPFLNPKEIPNAISI